MVGCLCKTCVSETCWNAGHDTYITKCSVYCSPKPVTNYDRIVSKTPEELAEWIERIRVLCANEYCGKACPLHEVCFSFAEQPTEMLDWLKQEAKE